jgi:hypothetical protein
VPFPRPRPERARPVLADFLLLDEGAHTGDFYAICVPKVVAEVELIEVERHDEGCLGGRVLLGADEGEDEIWTVNDGLAMPRRCICDI